MAGTPLLERDRTATRALYDRFLVAVKLPAAERKPAIETLAREAEQLGDGDFAARLTSAFASEQGMVRDYAGARATWERARAMAQQLESPSRELRVVTDHARFELITGDLARARILAEAAKALLPRAKLESVQKALTVIGNIARAHDQHDEAAQFYQRALEDAARNGRDDSEEAFELRVDLLQQRERLARTPADVSALRELAERTLARIDQVPERHPDRRRALFLASTAYERAGDRKRGAELRDQAMALLRASPPAPGMSAINHQALIAGEEFLRGNFDEAIARMREVIEDTDRAGIADIGAQSKRGGHLAVLGTMLLTAGEERQAHVVFEQALLDVTGKLGPNHPQAAAQLRVLFDLELDLGDLDRAVTRLDALERVLRAQTPADPVELANVRVLRAKLARHHGKLPQAERLIDEALAELAEIKAPEAKRRDALLQRAHVRAALGRHAEAVGDFAAGTKRDRDHTEYLRERIETLAATTELAYAKSEHAAGQRDSAERRAKQALERLRPHPGWQAEVAEIERWLASRR
jgi:ATP/maltotriose-dependent transcriptional regulator MalT